MITGILAAAVLAATPQASAPTQDAAADLQCLAIGVYVMNSLAHSDEPRPGPRGVRPIVAYSAFFMGRLQQRDSVADWATQAVGISSDLNAALAETGSLPCKALFAASVTPLIAASQAAGLDLDLE